MVMNQLSTEFSIQVGLSSSPVPDFCKDICYNYFSSASGEGEIAPKFKNTRVLYLNNTSKVWTLVLTSSYITYWSDLWLNADRFVVDPEIVRMNFQNNLISEFTIEEERKSLEYLDLSNNPNLTKVFLPICPKLQTLKLNKLPNLESLLVGSNQFPVISRLELINSKVPAGLLSSVKFSNTPGLINLQGSDVTFNEEDREVLEFLTFAGYSILQDS